MSAGQSTTCSPYDRALSAVHSLGTGHVRWILSSDDVIATLKDRATGQWMANNLALFDAYSILAQVERVSPGIVGRMLEQS